MTTGRGRPRKPAPLGNKARGLVEDAMMHVGTAQRRMSTIDKQAERADELANMAAMAVRDGNAPLALAILLDVRSAAANVRRHEQDAAAALADAQATLGRCVRGEWE
jgi:hypothetical protein